MEGASTGNDGHEDQVDAVLDRSELCKGSGVSMAIGQFSGKQVLRRLTTRLLTRIWAILALRLVLPANALWRMPTRKWPSGALMKAPYRVILGMREVK